MIEIKKIKEVIASRSIRREDNENKIKIVIGKRNPILNSPDYYCLYQIVGIADEKIRYAAGIDAVQVLQLAMVMTGADLYKLKGETAGHPRWEGG